MTGSEKIHIKENVIEIDANISYNKIMHAGEKELMKKLADIATKNGGDILEIGFGLHLSADAIQSNPNVKSHTIIEVHPEIYKTAIEWSKDKKNVKIILGDWIDILPIKNEKFDGVLHDTHLDPNIPKFLDYIKPNCKEGTIVAFFEYLKKDKRINGYRFSLPEYDWESLPYKDNIDFKNNQYELKYTTFNGIDFYKENVLSKLL
jgi:predicted O-methyltransferase YrrM